MQTDALAMASCLWWSFLEMLYISGLALTTFLARIKKVVKLSDLKVRTN